MARPKFRRLQAVRIKTFEELEREGYNTSTISQASYSYIFGKKALINTVENLGSKVIYSLILQGDEFNYKISERFLAADESSIHPKKIVTTPDKILSKFRKINIL